MITGQTASSHLYERVGSSFIGSVCLVIFKVKKVDQVEKNVERAHLLVDKTKVTNTMVQNLN